MSTEIEERIRHPDLFLGLAQDVLEQADQDLFEGCSGAPVVAPLARPIRSGQSTAIDLAIGRQGQFIENQNRRWHEMPGKAGTKTGPEFFSRKGCGAARHIGHQPEERGLSWVLLGHHHRGLHTFLLT